MLKCWHQTLLMKYNRTWSLEVDLSIHLATDIRLDYLQRNIILLVHSHVSIADKVHRVDPPAQVLRRVE